MLSYFSMFLCICAFVGLWATVETGPWASPALEQLDEMEDAEIYKAVVTSMAQWQERQREKKLRRREKRQQSSVCYKDLGCFEATGPFGYLDMLPGTPEEISTKFLLYPGHRTRRNGFSQAEVPFNNLTYAFKWAQQGFNKSLPTKVLIHGFGSDCSHIWVYELRSALMAVEEMNIICVDWAKGAELPNYVKAATNTRLIGKQLSVLLRGLMEHAGISARNLHLIGFSLGAHVAGFAGAELGNVSRITGLDPAGPLFESQDPRARLDQTDAGFVDVIHSNGENIILGGLGSWQPLGHVDFYPNGGRMQKGCTNIFVGAVSDIIWSSAIEGRSLCNHRRAYKFFTDSVSPRCHFPAFPCESYEAFLEGRCFPCTEDGGCGNMGYYADRSKGRGQLFLITRDEEPFCAHQYNVKIESSISDIPITSYGKIQITLVGDSALNETFVMTKKDDDEMKLGHSISRILVPHPVLAEPTKIQILYTAYSGWLSSGLTHWKIDKITLSDSFGKSSSICKKSLILQSGIPVTLPLYPGQCNLPTGNHFNNPHDRLFDLEPKNNSSDENISKISKFVPTPVVRIGNEAINRNYIKDKDQASLVNSVDIFNVPWQQFTDEKDNRVDDEKETSRALNTRVIKKHTENLEKSTQDTTEVLREVVEPILKPHSNKNARSHDPDKDKLEISEPILGPTTARITFFAENSELPTKMNTNKEITYNFYDSGDDWVPSINSKEDRRPKEKWKRHDHSKSITSFDQSTDKPDSESDGFNLISMTVQFLPQRLARMFEQAEKYARETILPFVSAHTPKIIRNFIAPDEKPKYLPLNYEESSGSVVNYQKISSVNKQNVNENILNKRHFDQPPTIPLELLKPEEENQSSRTTTITSPYTHIQKISKRIDTVSVDTTVLYEDNEMVATENVPKKLESNGSAKSLNESTSKEPVVAASPRSASPAKQSNGKDIYIDLPVFDENYKELKYIPFIKNENHKSKKLR